MRNAVRNTAHISDLGDPDAMVDAADEMMMSKRAANSAGDLRRPGVAKRTKSVIRVGTDADTV